MTCASCGLTLPAEARFCARCGTRLADAAAPVAARAAARRLAGGPAPVWLIALLWIGAAGSFLVALLYAVIAAGALPPESLGSGQDVGSVRAAATLIALCSASLCAAHVAAAVGLMTVRPWARTFATMVCVVWALTCVGMPLGLLGISAMWRSRRDRGPGGPLRQT